MEKIALDGRICAECKEYKGSDAFSVRNTGTLYSYCKPCNSARTGRANANRKDHRKAYAKKWYAENRANDLENSRKKRYFRVYGITFEQVLEKLAEQDFQCDICKKEITEKSMVVDHCHGSGNVRGILCNLCNISLSPIERDGFLQAALSYIERHRSKS